jgi:hypothetical protein
MVLSQLEKKVEQVHCDREVEHNRREFKRLTIEAAEATRRSMDHPCRREGEIHEMKKDIRSWEIWFRRAVFGFIGFLLVVGSGWLWQFFTLRNSVAKTEASWQQVSASVSEVRQSQDALREIVRTKVQNGDATKEQKNDREIGEIKQMLSEMISKKKRPR